MVVVIMNGFQHLGSDESSQHLPLFVDLLIAATTKVDALKTAGLFIQWLATKLLLYRAFLLDDQCMSGCQFFHLAEGYIESRHDGRTFAGGYHYFIVMIIIGRTNAIRITQ